MASAAGLAALLILIGMSTDANPDGSRVSMLLMLLFTYTVIALALDRARLADTAPLALGGLLVLELFITAYPNLNDRVAAQKSGASVLGSYQDGTPQALGWLRANRADVDLVRVEKSYNSAFLCDSLVQDYNGIASYFFHGASLTAITDGFGLKRPVAAITYIGHADKIPGLMPVLGVKYLLSRGGQAPPGWRFAHQVAGISIFEDPTAEGIAQFRTRSVSTADMTTLPPEQRARVAQGAVIVDARITPRIGARVTTPAAAMASPERAGSTRLLKWENKKLTAVVDARTAGMVVISVPFDPGWTAEMDGQCVQTAPVNYGFIGIEIPPGQHTIKLRYRPAYRLLGWAAFTAALLLLAAASYRRLRLRRGTASGANRIMPR